MDIQTEQNNFLMQLLTNSLPAGIITCNFDEYYSIIEVNEGFFRLTGYTSFDLEERFNNHLTEMIHPDDCQMAAEVISKQFLNNEQISLSYRLLCKDGLYKQIQYDGCFLQHMGEEKLTGVMVDRAGSGDSRYLDFSKAVSPFISKHTPDLNSTDVMIFEWDIASDSLLYSHNWNKKYDLGPVYNQIYRDISNHRQIHPEDTTAYIDGLNEIRDGSAYVTAEFRLLDENEQYTWCQVHAINLYDDHGKPSKAIGIIFDIDEKKRAMNDLKTRAERDALTGLYNRNETEKQIKAYLSEKSDRLCALFMIDTDNFKYINDTKGHMLGDMVLTEMAHGMKKTMRDNDVVGRIGGDEFTIFMKDLSSREDAEKKASSLSEMFRHLFENEKRAVQITCSIGVALYPDDGKDFQTLYKHADHALYQAKSQGKDGYVIYDQENSQTIEETGYSSLGSAIESQPISLGVSSDLPIYIFKLLYKMEDLDQAVQLSLEVVGKWFDVSRAYIFETFGNGEYYKNTYEWCNEGIPPEIENLQWVDRQRAGDYKELFGDDSIYYCRNTHSLPPVQRKLFEDQGIHSILQYALWENKEFAGFIGFDECTGMRLWTKEEISALSLVSEILDTFLQKKKIKEREQAMQHIAAEESIVDCIKWLTTSDYLDDSIEYVLEVIQKYYQSDRVYIIEVNEEKGTGSNTYEVCANGVTPQIENLQDVPIEVLSFWMKQFLIRDFIKIDDIEELGSDRQMEYEILKEQGIKSLMALPLHVKGETKGFLGIDDPKVHKENFHYLNELSYFIENEIAKITMQKLLKRMSYEDALTGLENRNSYMAYCDDFSKRLPVPAGIIFMDINGLKKLNDARGHVYGDMVITHIADVMKQYFPDGRKFRLSGDEFLIVTESISYDDFNGRLHAMEEKLTTNAQPILSIGTTWSDVDSELTELVNKADKLMYINKQDYYKGYKDIAAEKIPLLKDLTDSILNRQYLIYLQPKFNMKTQKIDCAEVLIRYREKDGSISSPIKFIPLLESEGLISGIDFFVLDEVCQLLTRWKDTSFADIQLSLNFSRITMFDKNFFTQFWKIFKKYDLNPEQLEVEITETQETLNKKQMALLLDELKKHHFKIALDDFGVEYSSYEFLMMARFDVLKIDKGITQKYEEAAYGKTLIRHIVDMGHSIGMKCCAEGVETRSQFDYMKEIGCDYVQGYLIDKPLPVDQFETKYLHFELHPCNVSHQADFPS